MQFSYVHREKTGAEVYGLLQQQQAANAESFTPEVLAAAQAAINALPQVASSPDDPNPMLVELSINAQIDKEQPARSYVNVSARYVSVPNV